VEGAPGALPRVLLVDDEAAVVDFYATALGADRFAVSTAFDGAEAAALMRTHAFDVIVSDVAMPGMDGLALLRKVRETDLDVPVILVTGGPTLDAATEAMEYGALRYLAKPVQATELKRMVEFAVDIHRMARAKREALTLISGAGGLPGDRAGLEARLQRSLDAIWLAYQPVVSWSRKRAIAYEVFARSGEPMLAHPQELFETALLLGRVGEVSRAVRAKAAASFDKLPADADLFVNIHPSELKDRALLADDDPLLPYAKRVVLEISERESLHLIPDLRAQLRAVRERGYRIALDDLGVGHAGLQTFIVLEPDVVKLDIALVEGIDVEEVRRNVVNSIVELCHKLEVHVVTEGVETAAQCNAVLSTGCDLLQGYFFGRPANVILQPKL